MENTFSIRLLLPILNRLASSKPVMVIPLNIRRTYIVPLLVVYAPKYFFFGGVIPNFLVRTVQDLIFNR